MDTLSSQTEKSTLSVARSSHEGHTRREMGLAVPWKNPQNQGHPYEGSNAGLPFGIPPSGNASTWLFSNRAPSLWGWVFWLLSILAISSLLSFCKVFWLSTSTSSHPPHPFRPASDTSAPVPLGPRSTCGSGTIKKGGYDMGIHVGALFIILFVSGVAAGFPVLAKTVPGLKIPNWALFTMRHFGTGVILGAAFIHLLPPAFVYLNDPCLGDFWVKDYPAISGVIVMSSVFLVVVIEMLLHPGRKAPRVHQVSVEEAIQRDTGCAGGAPAHEVDTDRELTGLEGEGHQNSNPGNWTTQSPPKSQFEVGVCGLRPAEAMTPEQKQRWDVLQCVLLELGILVHSVFIGMTLSVSIGNKFVILLIAIIFHQLFEGLALGSRIANITWRDGAKQPWLMALAYGCTTPVGQAIGLATHMLYSPDSKVGLLVVGILSAISAGLLTFASLVELLAVDFLSDESWQILHGKARVYACLLVFFGAFLMSLVGAWA